MPPKPHVVTAQQREARQRRVEAAPVVAEYRGIEEVAVELKFHDPEGKQNPSPRGVVYASHMHAFFDFTCPLRDCTGGGYDATADLQAALGKKRNGYAGKLSCNGTRARGGIKNQRCNLEVNYTLSIRGKAAAAA